MGSISWASALGLGITSTLKYPAKNKEITMKWNHKMGRIGDAGSRIGNSGSPIGDSGSPIGDSGSTIGD